MTDKSDATSRDYYVIGKNEYDLYKSQTALTQFDAEKILENQEVFKKFLLKSKFNYQIELSKGTYKGREQDLYRGMDVCDELVKGLDNIETAFKKYNQTLEDQKEA